MAKQTLVMFIIYQNMLLMTANAVIPVPEIANNANVNDVLTALNYKLETYTKTLTELDANVKSLHEKSHNWVIFRHHIEAWNSQMQAIEQKLQALQRGEECKHTIEAKMATLEFTLSHLLTQVVNLTDKCEMRKGGVGYENVNFVNSSNFKEFEKRTNNFKHVQNEAISRLNNILRYAQKHDLRSDCGNEEHPDTKLIIWGNMSHKDVRHLQDQTKKNTKNLNTVAKSLGSVQKRISQWQENANNNVNYMTKQCQSATKELSTFTESSDLLLKRIETLVRNFGEKLNNVNWHFTPVFSFNESVESDESIQSNGNEAFDPYSEQDADCDLTTTTSTSEDNNTEETLKFHSDANEISFIQAGKGGCHELERRIDGIYTFDKPILNDGGRNFNERLCVFLKDGSAWTVIQNRGPYDEQENFNRSWSDYSLGFGQLHKDFWFGNEFIHFLVYQNDYELRIELEDFAGENVWAEYKIFRIDSEQFNYNLLIGNYIGNVGDAMKYHNEMDFSTFDRRNDHSLDGCCSCATGYGSGWWFNKCAEANLNGIYRQTPTGFNYVGIIWETWRIDYSLQKVRMLIRPKHSEDINNNMDDP